MTDLSAIGHLGPPITPGAPTETSPPSDPISLAEHDSSGEFEISDEDAEFIESLDNLFDNSPITITYTRDGLATIETGAHVGVLTLPSGVQIEVTPKRTVTNLLWVLQYAFDTPVSSADLKTEFTLDTTFFDAIGILFQTELQTVLDRGLHRDYTRTRDVRDHVQGRIDVQRQLQRPAAVTTDFAVEYDDFTADTLLNQSVLAALRVLRRLVRDDTLASRLHNQEHRLRKFVTIEPVSLASVEHIELSRLNDHYVTLLDLTKTILARDFFDDITAGGNRSLALFVNMNDVFEHLIERAFRNAAHDIGELVVHDQASIPNIVDGPHAVSMRPDVLITRPDDTPITVIDAKWKTDSISSSDIYQLTSYILALDTPGALAYPGQESDMEDESTVMDEHSLHSIEIATDASAATYAEYVDKIEQSASEYLQRIVGKRNHTTTHSSKLIGSRREN